MRAPARHRPRAPGEVGSAVVPRISLFEPPHDPRAFTAEWRLARAALGARLWRSHSPNADFRFAELADADTPAPDDLSARCHSARYEVLADDLPAGAPLDYALINPFEVPAGEEGEFVPAWTAVRDLVRHRRGYLGSRLHRTLDPGARFSFVNLSPWATVQDFTTAVTDPAFATAVRTIYHRAHPSLFVLVG